MMMMIMMGMMLSHLLVSLKSRPCSQKKLKQKKASSWEKTNKYETNRRSTSTQGNGTNQLWYNTTPYHLQPNHTRNMSMAFYVHPEKEKKSTKKDKNITKYYVLPIDANVIRELFIAVGVLRAPRPLR